jgi:multiple sugar transport system permease protein/putative aldouronate transport system permease protein
MASGKSVSVQIDSDDVFLPHVKDTGSDRVFAITNYIVLGIVLLGVIAPLMHVLASSFSSTVAVMSGHVLLWPVDFSLAGYEAVFNYKRVWVGLGNSLFYSVFGTLVNVIMTFLAAYPLARANLPGRKFFTFLFLFTMLFHGGLIPTYLNLQKLGLLDTRWVMILPKSIAIWNLLITITYLRTTIPTEIHDAAQIDGCSDIRYLISIVLPLSKPIIAVIALFYAVQHWNTYFDALIYLRDYGLHPLQIILREILVLQEVEMGDIDLHEYYKLMGLQELLKYALIVVAAFPILVVYPFVQKYFIKGMMIGSVK